MRWKAAGKGATGKEATGKEATGKDATGKDATGKDAWGVLYGNRWGIWKGTACFGRRFGWQFSFW